MSIKIFTSCIQTVSKMKSKIRAYFNTTSSFSLKLRILILKWFWRFTFQTFFHFVYCTSFLPNYDLPDLFPWLNPRQLKSSTCFSLFTSDVIISHTGWLHKIYLRSRKFTYNLIASAANVNRCRKTCACPKDFTNSLSQKDITCTHRRKL